MPYRDEQRCHICGAPTRTICPSCENAVCTEHTLAGRVEGGSARAKAEAERLARRVGGTDACTTCLERELEASQGPFVEILRSGDPIRTQMVVEALLEEGFDARALGTQNAALLGAGQHIFDQRIEVPEPQAEAALRVVEDLEAALEAPSTEEPADDPDLDTEDSEADDPDDPAAGHTPRRRGIAAGLAFIFPGASHYYARHPWIGMCFTVTFFSGLFFFAQGAARSAAVLLLGTPALDLVAGQFAVGAHNRGAPRSVLIQLVQGGVMSGALFLLATLLR
jgi:hypothetical protein